MSLVLIGEGDATVKGAKVSGAVALKSAGIAPLTLGPKEGLALLNGTQVSTALALLGLVNAERNTAAAILAGALSLDAIMGSDTPFDARIHALRPHAGQILAASHYRRLMAGSEIRLSHLKDDDRVQDPHYACCWWRPMAFPIIRWCLPKMAQCYPVVIFMLNPWLLQPI
jgi:histidine ammonia-lyase